MLAAAGCSGPEAVSARHLMDGLVGHLTEVLPHDPMIESVSACGCSCTAASTATRGRITPREPSVRAGQLWR
jgi:hypothetical protein